MRQVVCVLISLTLFACARTTPSNSTSVRAAGLARADQSPADASSQIARDEGGQEVSLRVQRFVLTRGVEDREPVDVSNDFITGERVYAFLHLVDVVQEQRVTVHWEAASGHIQSDPVQLTVKAAPRFRTWSWLTAPSAPGSYRCVVKREDGTHLIEEWFDVAPG